MAEEFAEVLQAAVGKQETVSWVMAKSHWGSRPLASVLEEPEESSGTRKTFLVLGLTVALADRIRAGQRRVCWSREALSW